MELAGMKFTAVSMLGGSENGLSHLALEPFAPFGERIGNGAAKVR